LDSFDQFFLELNLYKWQFCFGLSWYYRQFMLLDSVNTFAANNLSVDILNFKSFFSCSKNMLFAFISLAKADL